MATLKLTAFEGEIPKLIDRLLPDTASSFSSDVRLTSGGIQPIRESIEANEFVSPPDPNDATIYRFNDEWYIWNGLTHAVPGPVATDRLYVTGDGVPKMIVSPDEYDLKITNPSAALTLSKAGVGTGEQTVRLYVYTFVTSFGEETKPSPISDEILWQDGETVTLAGFELGDAARGVTTQRIYRSQTGPTGTQLYFIAERPTSVADFDDNVDLEDIQEPVPSLSWDNPPDALEGIISLPNGNMAAFVGKTVYFCEPYRPHAWPEIYALEVDYGIVGLSAFGTSLVVATEGNPYLISGSTPDTMYMRKLELNLPCVSARSIVDLGYTAAYASVDGLVTVNESGAQLVSLNLFSQEDWRALLPENFACGQNNGWYFFSYTYVDDNNESQEGTFYIDLSGNQPTLVRTAVVTRSFYYEIQTGKLFFYKDGSAFEWDGVDGVDRNYSWQSKTFTYPTPVNFGAILALSSRGLTQQQIEAEQAAIDAIIAENQVLFNNDDLFGSLNDFAINETALNGGFLLAVPEIGQQVQINVYGDGVLRGTITEVNNVKRLPGGYRARDILIEVTGNTFIDQIELATSGKELGSV